MIKFINRIHTKVQRKIVAIINTGKQIHFCFWRLRYLSIQLEYVKSEYKCICIDYFGTTGKLDINLLENSLGFNLTTRVLVTIIQYVEVT